MHSSVRRRGAHQTLVVLLVVGAVVSGGTGSPDAQAADPEAPARPAVVQSAARNTIAAAPQALSALQLAARYSLTYMDAGNYVMLEGRRLRVRMYPGTRMAVVAGKEFQLKDRIQRTGGDVLLSNRIVGFLSHRIETFFSQENARALARRARPARTPLPPLPRRAVVTRVRKTEPAAPPAARPRPAARVEGAQWIPPAAERDWKWIVIHHSDDREGSVAKYDRYHRYTKGWEHGCGYHFVIGNGTHTGDGQVEMGPRWIQQLHGAHAKTPDNRFNDFGVGICLVGDFEQGHCRPTEAQMDALVRLTRWLMERYGIEASEVRGHGDCCDTCCPGRNFPWAEYRRGFE